MAKSNRAKSSKKPITKDKYLPESVQWLLDFVNLGCKPGVLLLKRLHEEVKIDCPPKEPAAFRTLLVDYMKEEEPLTIDKECSIEDRLEREFKSIALKEHKGMYSKRFIDINGNEWMGTVNGKFLFIGNENDFPKEEEIRGFLRETGIDLPQEKKGKLANGDIIQFIQKGLSAKTINTTFWNINKVWLCTKYALGTMQEGIDINPIQVAYSQSFVTGCYDSALIEQPEVVVTKHYGIKYTHDNTFIQTTCAYIQDFWNNHRELHTRLRQCKCCGRFEIPKEINGVKGRKKKYCSDQCKDTSTRKSRKADNALKASSRERKRQEARDEIINWLCSMKDSPYSRKEAEEIYENESKLHPNNVTSLETFKNTYGRRTYLI